MEAIWKQRGKECLPEKTVQRIKASLEEMGIETEHTYTADVMQSCYSSRVTVKGPLCQVYGSNGKGVTREYCEASAYAELMERLENRCFPYSIHACDREGLLERSRILKCPVHDLDADFEQEESYASKLRDYILENSGLQKHFFNRQLVRQFLNHKFEYRDFYHVQAAGYEKLPSLLARFFTHSNGMASGNSVEEAIVQAVSEILERIAQTRIMIENITPPDIPDHVLNRYPDVIEILNEISRAGKYEVHLKDCSFGGIYPVAACLMIDKEKQTLGVRFGSHPDMGIALERTLTEAFQGRDMDKFTSSSRICFDHQVCTNRSNLMDTKKIGNGAYPCELLGTKPTFTFTDWGCGRNYDNRKLAAAIVKILTGQGYEVYIADNSWLGFPAVYVVALGGSEIRSCDLLYLKEMHLARKVMNYMTDLKQIDGDRVNEIIQLIQVKHHALMENTISSVYNLPFNHSFYTYNEMDFLLFLCYYYLKDYENAEKILAASRVLPEEEAHVKAIRKYVSAKRCGYSDVKILEVMSVLCPAELAQKVDEELKHNEKVFEKFYPLCRNFQCGQCTVEYCRYPNLREFENNMVKKSEEWSGARENIHLVFEEMDLVKN